jgi:hypothetical protein
MRSTLMSLHVATRDSTDGRFSAIHPARRCQVRQGRAPHQLHDMASRVEDVDLASNSGGENKHQLN